MIVGIVKGLMSFLFAAGLAYLLYHINIFVLGWYVPLFIALLFLSGWSIGFLVSSTIFQYGTRIQTLGWSFVWLFAPFAAVYYPLDILPQWAQVIAKTLPASYVFEQIRSLLLNGTVSWTQLGISLILNIIYLTISLLLIRKSFTILKKKGLAKLY
jgi:ABC-2 type transport system permease protein